MFCYFFKGCLFLGTDDTRIFLFLRKKSSPFRESFRID